MICSRPSVSSFKKGCDAQQNENCVKFIKTMMPKLRQILLKFSMTSNFINQSIQSKKACGK